MADDMTNEARAPLAGILVLDLATPRAELAGRILADLGADVIKIESPEGAPARGLAPHSDSDGTSLYWRWIAAGKHSVVLDLSVATDRAHLIELVREADVLIESDTPGAMGRLGLGYGDLSTINPRLVYLSVSPFGQRGPKSLWPATDLTLEAACGRVAMQGDADRPPLPIGYPQASLQAGAQGAADIVIALNERAISGQGQYLDLSMLETMYWTLMGAQGAGICRRGGLAASEDSDQPVTAEAVTRLIPNVLRAHDGYITIGPGAIAPAAAAISSIMRAEGSLEPLLDGIDFAGIGLRAVRGEVPGGVIEAINRMLAQFMAARTQLQIVDFAHRHDLRIGPLYTTRSILADPHLNARGYFVDVGGSRVPGAWARLSRTPLRPPRAAPALGSSTLPRHRGKRDESDGTLVATVRSGEAFAGLKVADFSWVAAGPTIGKALADHGATVVKLESSVRPDLSRTLAPFFDDRPGLNRSYWSCLYMTSKLSLACNLGVPEGRELARRVTDWADVVIESFSPGTMQKLGLDYQTLTANRPDLVMLSTSLLGQTGPLSTFAGFGQQGCGFSGHHAITGWPDRAPCGVFAPYTDVIAPKFGIAALAAALLERRRTGLGQYIDLAQVETGLQFIAPLLLDEAVNGRTAPAAGHDSMYACPHGIFPTRDERGHLALAVETNEQWRALRTLVPGLPLSADATLDTRLTLRTEIDGILRTWCKDRNGRDAEAMLIEVGVPAAVVAHPDDLLDEPQFAARAFLQHLNHSELGDTAIWGFPTRFSARATMVRAAPPCFGEHSEFVLRELLGLSGADISRYRDAEALR
jgi:crotonobetainyl-CoA:carnitine CoA-transferase CaiB-like acyl-CoA transferase